MFSDNTDLISKFGYIVDFNELHDMWFTKYRIDITLYDKLQEPFRSWMHMVDKLDKDKEQLYIKTNYNGKLLQNFELYKHSETEKTITFCFYVDEPRPYDAFKTQKEYILSVFKKHLDYELILLDLKKQIVCLQLDLKDVRRQ